MKQLTAAALLVGGAILASQSAFAQSTFVQGDLYMGFQNSAGTGSTADYIINLGAASGIVGQTHVVDLSSDFSTSLFSDPSFQGTSAQIYGGVVGGVNSALGNGTATVYATALRTANIGNAALAGSLAPGLSRQTYDNSAIAALTQIVNAPSAGTGILDASKSWEAYVEPTYTTASFYGSININPDSAVSPSSVLYEDLWTTSDSGDPRGSNGQPWNYAGYFTLNLGGAAAANIVQASLTFTPQSVPEPTVLALLGGAGLLLFSFRRRFNQKNA